MSQLHKKNGLNLYFNCWQTTFTDVHFLVELNLENILDLK